MFPNYMLMICFNYMFELYVLIATCFIAICFNLGLANSVTFKRNLFSSVLSTDRLRSKIEIPSKIEPYRNPIYNFNNDVF